jgi:hypothetical protein
MLLELRLLRLCEHQRWRGYLPSAIGVEHSPALILGLSSDAQPTRYVHFCARIHIGTFSDFPVLLCPMRNSSLRLSFAVLTALVLAPLILTAASRDVGPAKRSAASSIRDLSGIWSGDQSADTFSPTDPPLTPWAEAKFRSVKPGYGPHASALSDDPLLDCLPPGVPRILLVPFPMQIVQIPGETIMLFEYDHYVRHIYTSRREHPKGLQPTWMGDSIGRWEGNTFVVDTVGLTEKSWLDQVGHPHSDQLHVVERIRRINGETLEDRLVIDDPKAYLRAWTGKRVFKLRPGWHLMEYICEDHMEEPSR